MKRLCRRLAVAVAVLVWLGALVYLLVLSRRKLPELGTGAGAGVAGGGETAYNQISDAEWEDMLEGFDERGYLSARRWKPGDDPYTLYAFNQRESERIPSNRALRDTRHYRYKETLKNLTRKKHKTPHKHTTQHTDTETYIETRAHVHCLHTEISCNTEHLCSV
ncbi:polypeptide N-acetylgalactosaminyltransferase 14-like [Stegastes partitus]|uniref:Polypeptide N-acetylgalactosaminyltransferase 14-like n=1 Tax=Stegastes partitus TaxID=144197 RepID=A0A9Y4N8K3_9TELE|nr:PREDICTED: polypeptide N-acetylgalactosaminyltransferase 14-like [Stegastes partitus]